jgi:hypothetical protein
MIKLMISTSECMLSLNESVKEPNFTNLTNFYANSLQLLRHLFSKFAL